MSDSETEASITWVLEMRKPRGISKGNYKNYGAEIFERGGLSKGRLRDWFRTEIQCRGLYRGVSSSSSPKPGDQILLARREEYIQIANSKQTRSAPSPVWSPSVVVS
jgi:hypothetical protein